MLKTVERYPAEGMSFESLGEPSAVSGVSLADQHKSCDSSPRLSSLLFGIEKIVKDLVLIEKELGKLDFEAFGIEEYQTRRHISSAILDAEIKLFHLARDIRNAHGQRFIEALLHV
ncbi:hypothetical protein [Xylella fastidiosa]|uniref:hypothetical protein n=1 Tax=Xylella fastidiosa TaxID=2371 RepID=UPI001656CBBF|nr:hypothetical protein [Xylella fastidiosa]